MKKKILILCSLISLLLVTFSLPICAEEDSDDSPSILPIPNSIRLDSYFYDNYDLLPYIQSTSANSYIDTGIKTTSELRITFKFSDIASDSTSSLFGSRTGIRQNALYLAYARSTSSGDFNFYNGQESLSGGVLEDPYRIYDIVVDKNNLYLNGINVVSLPYVEFSSDLNIYLFGLNGNGNMIQHADYKLYNLSIYDYSTESFVRYYYPAKSKTGGVVGLYDAVSDTFFPSSGSVPFTSPVNNQVMNFQISDFLTAGLGWIGDIFTAIINMPLILLFMAIGLAGVAFRWARRVVHF